MKTTILFLSLLAGLPALANEAQDYRCPPSSLPVFACKAHPETAGNPMMKNLLTHLTVCRDSSTRKELILTKSVDQKVEQLEFVRKFKRGEITSFGISEMENSETIMTLKINVESAGRNAILTFMDDLDPSNHLTLTCLKPRSIQ